eukprot:CAMPEP_0181291288 /NCGR_PEP_ID=MMETSP1101-20121128/1885_1 /TAXON_ID=46948 /ORGANISM="Rhodomonas abbreviata, Strain Caron Lab Isolate" /LENGTH=602 /DNA_ID=CAMNT_0023395665 /DNA_START=53 /DNA_END=1861 /DNA_ORIENTATION=+
MFESPPSEANVARYTGHINNINCMQVIDDAREAGEAHKTTYIFTGGYDHTARCFNAETGECLFIYRGHRSFVFDLRVGQENEKDEDAEDVIENVKWYLYTGSYDGTVRRWDIATGECVMVYELEYGSEVPRFRAGCVQLLEVFGGLFFTCTADKMLRAWSIADGECVWESPAHLDAITGMQLRPKHETATAFQVTETPEELYTCSADKTVRVWEPETGECKRVLRFDSQPLYSLHVRGDGALFVGAGSTIIYCDSNSGQAIRSFSCRHGVVKALWSDGERVYAVTGFVSQQFNIKNGLKERLFGGHKGVLSSIQVHDRTLYTTGDDAVVTWDTDPLLYCCMDGDLKTLRVLLSGTHEIEAVDPEMKTGSGNSAMLLAGKAGQSEIVESLLMYSADVHRMSRAGETALHGAAMSGAEKGVRCLLKAGANPNFSTPSQDISVDRSGKLIENLRVDAYGKVEGDQTALHYAARAGAAACCKLLIHGYADANFKDSRLRTPMMLAAMAGSSEALKVLLYTKCIDPTVGRYFESDFTLKDIQGKTALKLASTWECKRLIWKRYLEKWALKSVSMKAVGQTLKIPPLEEEWTTRRSRSQMKLQSMKGS